ncbi:MAG: aminopeptidase P family protein [Alphaproteobacteria bacterium]
MTERVTKSAQDTGGHDPALLAAVSQELTRAGATLDGKAVADLVRGVLAAPTGHDPDAWMALVAQAPDAALRDVLRRLRQSLAGAPPAAGPTTPAARLAALRQQFGELGIDGFLIPRADEHQNEMVPARAERLLWATGFSGSAGLAIVLADRAVLFVDGRYTLQAADQVDGALFEVCHMVETPATAWVQANLGAGRVLGYDPWLHTPRQIEAMAKAAHQAGGSLLAVADNPVDQAWTDQPAAPVSPVVPHPARFAGRSSADKRRDVAAAVTDQKARAVVLTAPDSIAWLLNIRGGDVPRTPLALSFAILRDDGSVSLFMDQRKVAPGLREHLGNGVELAEPEGFGPALDGLGGDGAAVMVDPASAPAWVFERLAAAGAEIRRVDDPCQLPKALKNETEIAGARAAHHRDGVALVRFLAWLSHEAASGEVTEQSAADHLAALRQDGALIQDLSFDTISGTGANGAIVHYRVSAATNRVLRDGDLYLFDSGGQYLDGTTDVTRTVAIGTPSEEQRTRYTQVLQGHIALARARFPVGTTGAQLDTLARNPLWQAGVDFDHGTGHGVGSYLGVHEGPQRISKGGVGVALQPGMIVSNEPGYYKTGQFGIRIENLVVVTPPERPAGGERDLLGLETLTLAPLDRRLKRVDLLTAAERDWVDAYHARVRQALTADVPADVATWLAAATRPLTSDQA